MANGDFEIGIIGAGTMGGNLALNIAEHGFSVALYDADTNKAKALDKDVSGGSRIRAGATLQEFTQMLRPSRAVLLLGPAGKPVDEVINAILPHLEKGDLIIDAGNSHFSDTNRRADMLAGKGVLFMGMGISGGEYGARHGPSLMPGGPIEAYDRVRNILEAAAAHVNGDPCSAHLGAGSAGHYVKMVPNGIEYGLMQLISETYDLMKRGLGMSIDRLAEVFSKWNGGALNSYLVEITAEIFRYKDKSMPGEVLIDLILDRGRQKGTGKWASWDAMDLQVPTPNIDAAVMMRNLSDLLEERQKASGVLQGPAQRYSGNGDELIDHLERALYAGMVITYAQGMALLKEASKSHGYGLNLETVARIWRAGCIIRAAVLEDIRAAFGKRPELESLLMDGYLGRQVDSRQQSLRAVVTTAAELGLPAPGFSASLAYFDAYRSAWLPVNLIQAQRDYFGAHHYERKDMPGKLFHTEWSKTEG